jgi:hypothetical protein
MIIIYFFAGWKMDVMARALATITDHKVEVACLDGEAI